MPTRKKTTRRAASSLAILAALLAVSLSAVPARAELEFEAVKVVETEGFEEEVPVHTTLDVSQVESEPIKFSIGIASISCTAATASTTLASGASPTLSLSPSYSGCKSGSFPAEINPNGCSYVVNELSEVEADLYRAFVDLTCPAEKSVAIKIKNLGGTKTKCIIHVPAQTNLTTATVHNVVEASPDDVTVKNEVEKAEATVTNGEESCLIPPGGYGNAKLSGTTTVGGTAGGEASVPPVKVKPRFFHFAIEKEEGTFEAKWEGAQEFNFNHGKLQCSGGLLQSNFFPEKPYIPYLYSTGSYQDCKLSGAKAEVKLNGCNFKMTSGRIEFDSYLGRTSIVCPFEESIEVISGACFITIPEQSGFKSEGLRRITYSNVGNGASQEITAKFTLNSLKYFEETCKGNGEKENGTYTGSMLMKAFGIGGGAQFGLWIKTTQ